MAGKASGKAKDVALSFRFSRELYDRLKAASPTGNVSEEMRHRLEASFADARAPDPKTRELLDAINKVEGMIFLNGSGGLWHEDPYLFAVFSAAVNELLNHKHFKPPGDPEPRKGHGVVYDPALPIDAIGRMLASFSLEGKRNA